jgi:hypothetical protein
MAYWIIKGMHATLAYTQAVAGQAAIKEHLIADIRRQVLQQSANAGHGPQRDWPVQGFHHGFFQETSKETWPKQSQPVLIGH